MDFVASKTVGEYNRNREKIRKFFLDEQKAKEAEGQQLSTSQPDTRDEFSNIPIERDQPALLRLTKRKENTTQSQHKEP